MVALRRVGVSGSRTSDAPLSSHGVCSRRQRLRFQRAVALRALHYGRALSTWWLQLALPFICPTPTAYRHQRRQRALHRVPSPRAAQLGWIMQRLPSWLREALGAVILHPLRAGQLPGERWRAVRDMPCRQVLEPQRDHRGLLLMPVGHSVGSCRCADLRYVPRRRVSGCNWPDIVRTLCCGRLLRWRQRQHVRRRLDGVLCRAVQRGHRQQRGGCMRRVPAGK